MNGYFPDVDYFHYYDDIDYFGSGMEPLLPPLRLLPPRPEDTGVAPKILLSTRVHPNPNPYIYALSSITYQLY